MKYLVLLAVSTFSFSAIAQDIIILKTGDEIKGKVIKVGVSEVEYKKDSTSPMYAIEKSKLFMIRYENGNKDVLSNLPNEETKRETHTSMAVIERNKVKGYTAYEVQKNSIYTDEPMERKVRSALHDARNYYGYYAIAKTKKAIGYRNETHEIELNYNYIIPVAKAKCYYEAVPGTQVTVSRHMVKWACADNTCIYDEIAAQDVTDCAVEFKTKDQCMKFIDLFSTFSAAIKQNN